MSAVDDFSDVKTNTAGDDCNKVRYAVHPVPYENGKDHNGSTYIGPFTLYPNPH